MADRTWETEIVEAIKGDPISMELTNETLALERAGLDRGNPESLNSLHARLKGSAVALFEDRLEDVFAADWDVIVDEFAGVRAR